MATETVLITGASSGIGWELARCFAADGADLILVARSEDRLRQLAEQLQGEYSIQARVVTADLSDTSSPQAIFDHLQALNLQVDVLVNNAGIGFFGPFLDIPVPRHLDTLHVNLTSLVHLSRLFLPAMVQRASGGILNIASTAAFQPGPNMAVYYATKAFVLSLTDALVEELRGTGVTVTCLAPGPTETDFGRRSGLEHAPVFQLGLMKASAAARQGHRAFRRGRPLVVPGLLNKFGTLSVRLLPRRVVRQVVKRLQTV